MEDKRTFENTRTALLDQLLMRNDTAEPATLYPFIDKRMKDNFLKSLDLWGIDLFVDILIDKWQPQELASEIICSLGKEYASISNIYAELTGRRKIIVLESIDEIFKYQNIAVVVACFGELNITDFEKIHNYSKSLRVLGLITGANKYKLLERVLITAAGTLCSYRVKKSPVLPSSALFAIEEYKKLGKICDRFANSHSKLENIKKILNTPSSTLTIVAHSDGLDMKLSNELVLCPKLSGTSEQESSLSQNVIRANCEIAKYCKRLKMPLKEAIQSEMLLSPGILASRVMILMSCLVLRSKDCNNYSDGSLFNAILDNPYVFSVVTSWEITYPSEYELIVLMHLLENGKNLNEALGVFMKLWSKKRAMCGRYILIGDPALRATAPQNDFKSKIIFEEKKHEKKSKHYCSFIKNINRLIIRYMGFEELLIIWLKSIGQKFKGNIEFDQNENNKLTYLLSAKRYSRNLDRKALNNTILMHLLSYGRWWDFCVAEGIIRPVESIERESTCFGCGNLGRIHRIETRFSSKWASVCAHCGIYYAYTDSQSSLIDSCFDLDEKGIQHNIPLKPSDTMALLVVSPTGKYTITSNIDNFNSSNLVEGTSTLVLAILGKNDYKCYCRLVTIQSF